MPVLWSPTFDVRDEELRATAAKLSSDYFAPLAEELDRDSRYPSESVDQLVSSGLAGMFLPEAYGGQNASLAATCVVMEEIARGCATTAAILSTYVLGAFPVVLAGSEKQRELCLAGLARRGEAVSFALTERESGSDAAAMQTTAEPELDGYRIRGEKWFVGNGGVSQRYIVFARTSDESRGRGVSAFIVEKDADGVVIDHLEDKMGIRAARTSNLRLDTHVPDDAMVGEPGRAMGLALRTLNVGRIGVAAQATGLAMAAYHEMAERAVQRLTFGKPIIENQGIGFQIADVATELSAARMLTYEAARAYDAGQDVSILGAMAKLYASEVSHRAVDTAVQVFGGYGYCKPYTVERLYRDQRVIEIYEGTSEIQRMVIGRGIAKEASEAVTTKTSSAQEAQV